MKVLIIPEILQVLLLASACLLAAWLGCPLENYPRKPERQTAATQ
jgi:hypothetical protein